MKGRSRLEEAAAPRPVQLCNRAGDSSAQMVDTMPSIGLRTD